ncbi:50S ribosomal protein L5 [Methanofollis formosanus]|uniref:Large ribosomal subunit protein uL5 n=1 Tax=Methanofollis formosanus TaxID=299308 RepID=A0A8G1A283_9EURY|nr:50S ribosomal protein L5 [Methanofollis formosanus]QYZ79091.1 50S ribosomal protein L5 [Methanofollis formosanus]
MTNPMQELHIDKVVVHMGVGESGERLVNGENIIRAITGAEPVRAFAKKTQPAFGVRKGAPIGAKVTLRGQKAEEFVQTAFDIVERRLSASAFDNQGNFSFGIEEHTDFPGQSYDPQIGIYGMDVNVILEKKGIRIARRMIARRKLPAKQCVTRDEAVAFMTERYGMEVQ